MKQSISQSKYLVYALFIAAFLTALIGVLIMTDIGQIVGVEKKWVVWYFKNSVTIQLLSLVFIIAGIVLANKHKFQTKKWAVLLGVAWLLCIGMSKYLTPYFLFRSQQYKSEYISISESEKRQYLSGDDRVLVVNHNGVQKAYPPEFIWQAHIFDGDFGDDNVVLAYCVMTNLATPYVNNKDGEGYDFKVLAQTNNNLLIWDTNSDEIIQQITQECEFSKQKLEPIPVLEMTFRGYKKLFPKGEVLYNVWDSPIEKVVSMLFDTEETWHGEEWMFKTSNFDDTRLPSKENIIGIRDDVNHEQIAFTKEFIKKQGIYNFEVGDKKLVMVYFPEYETIACYNREKDGQVFDVSAIKIDGNTEYGTLQQEYIYNSVLWAVWAYYYPESQVVNGV
ncbi:DUF3179 domain-containing (seleno)protein [Lutimonas sp.]|uniref:DUF3179 domain-containing (seleno)protein n=1 Tax=Lutimonas sp. TaxID=1872403 RepID=UPI003D9B8E05